MSLTIKGKVQKVTAKAYESQGLGSMLDHSIIVNTDSGNVTVHKHTKASTAFDLKPGTEVQITYDSTEREGQHGSYTINKIIKDGLVILHSGENSKEKTSTAKVTSTLSSTPAVKTSTYDPNGARNGMITGKAVELAIARKALDLDGLKLAASDVAKLAEFVELGAKTAVKELKETKKVKAVKVEVDEEEPFEFDE
jgi:hypothetical protein